MKGLLLKDFYMARKYCRAYVVIAVVFSLLAVWGNTSFLLAYPVLLASVIPVNLISYDEKANGAVFRRISVFKATAGICQVFDGSYFLGFCHYTCSRRSNYKNADQ